MIPVKDSPGRRATDNTHGLIQERQDEESGSSEISEGLDPEKGKSGSVRHDAKGNGTWVWADKFQRRRATDPPPDINHFGGEDLEVTDYKPASKTEPISSDIFEATRRMKAYSFDRPSWTQRVLSWFRGRTTRSR